MTPLGIEPLGEPLPEVDLADFLPGAGRDAALWASADERWLVGGERAGGRRRVRRWTLRADPPRLIDAATFELSGDELVELRGADRIALPRSWRVGSSVERLGGTLRLAWAGAGRLRWGAGAAVERRVLRIEASVGGQRRAQWLGEGIGELALGPRGEAAEQWLVGWRGAGEALGAPIPEALWALATSERAEGPERRGEGLL